MLGVALALALGVQAARPPLPVPRTVLACDAPLLDLAVDPRGDRVFTLGGEGELTAWELPEGRVEWKVQESGSIRVVSCKESILTCLGIPAVSSFDPKTGERTSAIAGPPPFTGTAGFAADSRGRWGWIGQERGLIRVTPGNVSGWSRRALDNGGVTALALDASDDLLAIGGKDGTIRFANCKSANVDDKKVFEGHAGPIAALAFLPKALVSAGEDGTVRVWTLSSGKVKHELSASGPVMRVIAAGKDGTVAAADGAGALVVWDAGEGVERARWTSPTATPLVALAFADKGATLLAAHGREVVAFDLALGDAK